MIYFLCRRRAEARLVGESFAGEALRERVRGGDAVVVLFVVSAAGVFWVCLTADPPSCSLASSAILACLLTRGMGLAGAEPPEEACMRPMRNDPSMPVPRSIIHLGTELKNLKDAVNP